jgi:hypothetical protein
MSNNQDNNPQQPAPNPNDLDQIKIVPIKRKDFWLTTDDVKTIPKKEE